MFDLTNQNIILIIIIILILIILYYSFACNRSMNYIEQFSCGSQNCKPGQYCCTSLVGRFLVSNCSNTPC